MYLMDMCAVVALLVVKTSKGGVTSNNVPRHKSIDTTNSPQSKGQKRDGLGECASKVKRSTCD